jgi:hypothetical protein
MSLVRLAEQQARNQAAEAARGHREVRPVVKGCSSSGTPPKAFASVRKELDWKNPALVVDYLWQKSVSRDAALAVKGQMQPPKCKITPPFDCQWHT